MRRIESKKEYDDLINDWIWLKLHDRSIADFCAKRLYNRILIYESGELGLLLYRDLLSGGLTPLAFLDEQADYHDFRCYDIPVIAPDNNKRIVEDVNAIIVAFFMSQSQRDETLNLLRNLYDCPVIFIEDIILELQAEINN